MSKTVRERLLASTIICGAVLAAAPAFAQQTSGDLTASGGAPVESIQDSDAVRSGADGNDAEVDEVVITGSRIPQPNLTSISPVTVVGAQDVQLRGVTRVEDLVNQLPSVFAAQNSSVSNGSTGTATINLRGLGTDRNLILVNGRRLPFGSPIDTAADVNQIPSSLVERVEVLTGGAASIYGSDAISGVVNFIMQQDFEGLRLEAQYGQFQHNNDYDTNGNLRDVLAGRAALSPAQFKVPDDNIWTGASTEVSAILGVGTDDGRGNITVYASYRDNDEVTQAEYDYSACTIGAATATGFTCGGSGTAAPGRLASLTNGAVLTPSGNDAFRPYTANDAYNFGPTNFYQRPDERYSLGAFARYELNEMAEVYAELMFTDYQTTAQIAPGGVFQVPVTVGCDNPFFTGTQAAQIGCGTAGNTLVIPGTDIEAVNVIVGRRNVEGGGRQDNLGYESFRIVTGMRGELAEGMTYDITGQFSEVTLTRSQTNDFYTDRIAFAIDATTDANGNPVCRNAATAPGTAGTCAPYNPFDPIGAPSAASLAYLQGVAVQTGTTQQQVLTGVVTYDLGTIGVKSPFADDTVKVAGGAEYRRDELESLPDVTYQTGNLSGFGGPTPAVRGATEVYDLFGEIQAPLVQGRPGVELLSANASYRFSDYDAGFNTHTYGFGGDYAPIDGLRFRASYARAVRAPNVIDLFFPQGLNLFDIDSDPCGPTPDAAGNPTGAPLASAAQCLATGVPAAIYGSPLAGTLLFNQAGQYNQLVGGNAGLEPEEADTYTLGVVFSPSFVEGLNITVDYFNIEIENLISPIDPTIIVDGCYGVRGQALNTDFCSLITRNAQGSIYLNGGSVTATNQNIGGLSTNGYDIAVNYTFDMTDFGLPDYGGFSISYIGTILNELITDPGVAEAYDCAGFYANACGVPNPEYRHNARLAYQSPIDLDLTLTWRYYGEVDLFVDPLPNRVDATFEAENYFDLAGTYRLRDSVTLRAGVNNVLDNNPPLSASVGTTGNGNTFPQTYDALGRYFFAGVTLDF